MQHPVQIKTWNLQKVWNKIILKRTMSLDVLMEGGGQRPRTPSAALISINLEWLLEPSHASFIGTADQLTACPRAPRINKSAGVPGLCWLQVLTRRTKFFVTAQITFCLHAHTECTCVHVACVWNARLTSFKLRLTVARVLLEALLLVDDDVLDVLHGQVVTEGVEQDVLELLQRDPLHVELWRGGRRSTLLLTWNICVTEKTEQETKASTRNINHIKKVQLTLQVKKQNMFYSQIKHLKSFYR